jgi:HEAT repeat protein
VSREAFERKLAALDALRSDPGSASTVEALRKALRDRSSFVAAKAARLAEEFGCADLVPDLASAFDRLLVNGAKTDPKCWGKNAIAKALKALATDDPGVFLRGAAHFQPEPVWGGSEDTATTLRSTCGFALTECGGLPPDTVLGVLADLLADPEAPVRADAARALAGSGRPEAALLVRLKIRTGDREASVTGECFRALFALLGDGALAVVAPCLGAAEPELRVEAAAALGESRMPAAVGPLKAAWLEERRPEVRGAILLALGALRLPEAVDFLLDLVTQGNAAAVTALAPLRGSEELRRRLADAVQRAADPSVESAFAADFPAGAP